MINLSITIKTMSSKLKGKTPTGLKSMIDMHGNEDEKFRLSIQLGVLIQLWSNFI